MKTQNNQKTGKINWKVRGPNWTYELCAPEDSDPMEIFTHCLEQVWGDKEGWKLSTNADFDDGSLHLEGEGNNEPSLSILLVLENSKMSSKDENLVVSTPLVLANAGLHNEASRLEKKWDLTSEGVRLKTIINILEGNNPN
jgi:hypothetical protein